MKTTKDIHEHTIYWKAFLKRVKAKAARRHAQLNRQCLTMAHGHAGQTARLALGYARLITFTIRLSRVLLFRETALPNGAETDAVHDRVGALFRRRAVQL